MGKERKKRNFLIAERQSIIVLINAIVGPDEGNAGRTNGPRHT